MICGGANSKQHSTMGSEGMFQ